MKPFKKITIVGVGLLGGSIGLAIKKNKLAHQVVGYFRTESKIALAVKKGAIDKGTVCFEEALKDSDFIILCSPVSDILKKMSQLTKTKALITDTGSTKTAIAKAGQHLNFVGSHPLAGSEQGGMISARADLFKNSLCLLTPSGKKSAHATAHIAEFWRRIGAKTIILTPEKHDAILAFTSHLPHIVAFSLMAAVPANILSFAAGGLKDTTRIAMSHPKLWSDIFLTNKNNAMDAITAFELSLKKIKKLIRASNEPGLISFLAKAKNKRAGLPQKS